LGRKLLVQCVSATGLVAATLSCGNSVRTVHKWNKRFEQAVLTGLLDYSSRPIRTRSCIDADLACCIEQLRRTGMPMHSIALTLVAQRSHHQSLAGAPVLFLPEGTGGIFFNPAFAVSFGTVGFSLSAW
jgi:hypothetical protein